MPSRGNHTANLGQLTTTHTMLVGATRQRVHAANAGEAKQQSAGPHGRRARILVVAIERLIEKTRQTQHQRRATRADTRSDCD
jgi:hypothetical protein